MVDAPRSTSRQTSPSPPPPPPPPSTDNASGNVEYDAHASHQKLLLKSTTSTGEDALPVEEEEILPETSVQPDNQDPEKPKPVSWSSLPRKDQLAILTLARLSEPLTQTSLQAYMFYQLKSFNHHLPDSTISYQAGMLQAAFTGAQFCTAVFWGRMADSERVGRKKVILIGLTGTAIGALGFGFSGSFAVALFWRALGGALNGNIGVMRTMISEIVRVKKFQSRAFLLLPMCFNIGVIIGPILGGLLADPAGSYPSLFGGIWWMERWPYALPNLVSAVFLSFSALTLTLGLEESHEALRDKPDVGIRTGRWIKRVVFRRNSHPDYQALSTDETDSLNFRNSSTTARDSADVELQPSSPTKSFKPRKKLPFRRIFTFNLILTFVVQFLVSSHIGTFNSLWFVFLSTPRYVSHPSANGTDPNASLGLPKDYEPHPPLKFTGGLALPPSSIGTALAILGVIGISLQLLLYPKLSFYLGTIPSFRIALCLFPIAYFLAPFLALVHTSTEAPAAASGPLLWIAITLVLCVQVTARTFALPAAAILINNSSPHPSVLGTVHGLGQTVSSAARTVGPLVMGFLYGVGLSRGYVVLAWWCMAGVAVTGAVAATFVREGDGHEIKLDEDDSNEERR